MAVKVKAVLLVQGSRAFRVKAAAIVHGSRAFRVKAVQLQTIGPTENSAPPLITPAGGGAGNPTPATNWRDE